MEVINLWHRVEKTAQEELKKYPGGTLDTRNGMYRIILKDKVVTQATPEEIMIATAEMVDKEEEAKVEKPVAPAPEPVVAKEIQPPKEAVKVIPRRPRVTAPTEPAAPGTNTI